MEKPKIVVLSGTSRFIEIMAIVAWLIEKEEGSIAMSLHSLPSWYRTQSDALPAHHLAEHEGVQSPMDELHLRKIDLADEIFVVDFLHYIGDSTKNEIAYAAVKGIPIRRYTTDPLGMKIDAMIESSQQLKHRLSLRAKQIAFLFEMCSGNDETVLSIAYGPKGHGGGGLYAYDSSCPFEGSYFLGEEPSPSPSDSIRSGNGSLFEETEATAGLGNAKL